MLKKLSFLVILATLALNSCRTVRFADVAPEYRGTAMGSVPIGRENVDFFVIPEPESGPLPYDFTVSGDDVDTSAAASSIVVFKTRERHPFHRTVHQFGAPMRVFDQMTSAAFDKAVAMAYSLVNRPGAESGDAKSEIRQSPVPVPAPVPDGSETGPEDSTILLPSWDSPQPIAREPENFAEPGATTADSSDTQTNRNRG